MILRAYPPAVYPHIQNKGLLDLYQVTPRFYFICLTNYHIQEHYFSEESKENYAISEP